jgi:hypothetical protein
MTTETTEQIIVRFASGKKMIYEEKKPETKSEFQSCICENKQRGHHRNKKIIVFRPSINITEYTTKPTTALHKKQKF